LHEARYSSLRCSFQPPRSKRSSMPCRKAVRPASGYAVNIAQGTAWERPARCAESGLTTWLRGGRFTAGKRPCQAPAGTSAMGPTTEEHDLASCPCQDHARTATVLSNSAGKICIVPRCTGKRSSCIYLIFLASPEAILSERKWLVGSAIPTTIPQSMRKFMRCCAQRNSTADSPAPSTHALHTERLCPTAELQRQSARESAKSRKARTLADGSFRVGR
jgi:hypothetical protein